MHALHVCPWPAEARLVSSFRDAGRGEGTGDDREALLSTNISLPKATGTATGSFRGQGDAVRAGSKERAPAPR